MEWFSLELQEERRVIKVQIARRQGYWEQGQDVKITIGPSKSYDPDEPLCLPEIADLIRDVGLQDYVCTGKLNSGKYVKISTLYVLVLCEVKVFTLPKESGKFPNSKGKLNLRICKQSGQVGGGGELTAVLTSVNDLRKYKIGLSRV